jgi:predicted Zn-dependent protease
LGGAEDSEIVRRQLEYLAFQYAISAMKNVVVKFHLARLILFAILVLAVPALTYAVPFISEEDEVSLGKGADKQVLQQYGIFQDTALQLYVNRVGQKLVSQLSDKIFRRYYFKLVDSSEINAFALPGGYIYVTRGLLATLNSEAELAGVLGHEIGHVIFHHGAKMMVRSIGAQILSIGGALANPENAGQWLVVSSAMFQQINMGYGREAELESDAQGMFNATSSGYNPAGMVAFLKNLRRQEIMSGQAYHSFQATHPETKQRIIKADLLSSSFVKGKSDLQDNKRVYLSHLKGLPFGGKRHSQDPKRYEPKYIDIYEVKEGDTFQSIGKEQLDDARADLEISVLNGYRESDVPTAGALLKLVKKGEYKKIQTLVLQPESP